MRQLSLGLSALLVVSGCSTVAVENAGPVLQPAPALEPLFSYELVPY
ncbi:MAG: hypothetical protein ISQ03_08740, partial [Pseudomonadales bacterium]|nr:hypothetical protein [Pseudomonadales bacterium]